MPPFPPSRPVRPSIRSSNSAPSTPSTQIPEPDALLQTLKTCLRTANQHLTTATLAALPPLVPLLVTRPPAQIPLPSSSTSPAASTSSAGASPVDAHALRQVLAQLMPAGGGVLDRLGDARERPRECARETLVVMGGFAFRAGPAGTSAMNRSRDKGPETPLQMFERFLREGGLGSKVWRVREQVRFRFSFSFWRRGLCRRSGVFAFSLRCSPS